MYTKSIAGFCIRRVQQDSHQGTPRSPSHLRVAARHPPPGTGLRVYIMLTSNIHIVIHEVLSCYPLISRYLASQGRRPDYSSAYPATQTVKSTPVIKSQLASRNQLWGLLWCKFGHVTLKISTRQNPILHCVRRVHLCKRSATSLSPSNSTLVPCFGLGV